MTNPYELWDTRTLLGVMRDQRAETWYFGQFFTNQMRSTDEWIDFEKLPIRSRTLAPFVKPLGRGTGVFNDRSTGYRFKPANVVFEDAVDPLRPITFQPGLGESLFEDPSRRLTPMQRLNLIKMQMMQEGLLSVMRRWEWMKARAIIDGAVTCVYRDGASVAVDFRRAANHTVTLGAGNRWGDSGISMLDSIKLYADRMFDAEFGGYPTRITMGGAVAALVQKDAEIRDHMDLNFRGGMHTVDRGILPAAKVYKLGELFIGGGSGQVIELWVNNETFQLPNGTHTRYVGSNEVIFTSTPDAIMGYECFGMIVDKDAGYEAIPAFPKNFETGDRVKVENLSIESAPLFVPINPNATLKLTAIA